MGEVWRAYDTVTEREVALKLLPAALVDDQVFQQRFRREARAAAGLNEPHVIPIFDFGEIEGQLFVTMRMIDGEDLQGVIDRAPLEPTRAVTIVEQIASALHAAHRIDLVHRDVKPSNILIAEDDFAYLIDFGIARAAGETGLTSAGATIGTWAYMAPERFEHGTADARADIYALTCVLFQALTGQTPFAASSLEQVAVAHMVKPPPRPSSLRAGVPPALDAVVARGLAKNPDDRYATTRDLATAARIAIQPSTHPASAPTHPGDPSATLDARHDKTIPLLQPSEPVSQDPLLQESSGSLPLGAPATERAPASVPRPAGTGSTRQSRWQRKPFLIPLAVGVIAAVGATVVMLTSGESSPRTPAAASNVFPSAAPSSAATTSPRVDGSTMLQSLVPGGDRCARYGLSENKIAEGAVGSLKCLPQIPGPGSAELWYYLYRDRATFENSESPSSADPTPCPGSDQPILEYHSTADPQLAGKLTCQHEKGSGKEHALGTLWWTIDSRLVKAVLLGRESYGVVPLYKWWQSTYSAST